MRIILFLLIVILQRSACVNESLIEILRSPIKSNEKDAFAPHTNIYNALKDEDDFRVDIQPDAKGFNHGPLIWPGMKQDKRSSNYPYQKVPLSIFKNIRRKRPDKSHLQKLNYLLNNYREDVEPPEVNFEESNKKRTHLFGFWTNYLARN